VLHGDLSAGAPVDRTQIRIRGIDQLVRHSHLPYGRTRSPARASRATR
jgi:hypothetical protein